MQLINKFLIFLSFIFIGNLGIAQKQDFSKKIIKFDLFYPTYALTLNDIAGSLSFDYNIKDNHGVQGELFYYNFSNKYSTNKSFQVIPQYKYSFNNNYKNLYIGCYLKYKYFYQKEVTAFFPVLPQRLEYTQQSINFGLLAGCQIYLGRQKKIVFDIITGIGYGNIYDTNYIVKEIGHDIRRNVIDGIFAINIGYVFYSERQ